MGRKCAYVRKWAYVHCSVEVVVAGTAMVTQVTTFCSLLMQWAFT